MKLWDKGIPLNSQIELFTTGKDPELDILLAPYDIIGSIAHAIMLERIGILNDEEGKSIRKALAGMYRLTETGNFLIGKGIEDVHSQVEKNLIDNVGQSGKKIHTARSRNDQVLLDLHLYMRDELADLVMSVKYLALLLLELSEKHKDEIIPGYTHFQVAMPSSFGLWFGSFAEMLADDLLLIYSAYRIINQNPLGSAAGFGTSFPIDRRLTTQLLGFDELRYNTMYAMNMRGKAEKVVAVAVSSVAETIAKLSMDCCLYMSQHFNFIELPVEYTTGSSIMPHKKNPDVFELVRGKCNKVQSLPNEISLLSSNLPSGYHRDFQLIKESLFPALNEIEGCLRIMISILPHLIIKPPDLKDEKYKFLFSVESVNRLVMDGVPFREAYQQIAKEIDDGHFKPEYLLHHTHEGSIGNLCTAEIQRKIEDRAGLFNFSKYREALKDLLKIE